MKDITDSTYLELVKVNVLCSKVEFFSVTACDVYDSLRQVKLGKSADTDGLAAEHFVYSHERISVHLAMLFTSMLTHGYLPDAFMTTSINPILKNKNGDTSAKNNYRPITIVTAM